MLNDDNRLTGEGVAPARAAAFDILVRVDGGNGHSDELLRDRLATSMSAQDRHLATTLVMGTLRWQSALDAQITELLTRADSRLSREVRTVLRLGAFQLLHLDRIPAHAAIGESVELAKRSGFEYAAGMVNAVLRKIATAPRERRNAGLKSADAIATATGHPGWLVERWVRQYGLENARQICEYDQQIPPVVVRLIGADADEALQSEGVELEAGQFLSNARRVTKGDVTATRAWHEGLVRLQDEGSQLVAELAGSVEGAKAPTILDMCAAPGGKTAILSERNPAASMVACDVSPRRLKEMERLQPAELVARTSFVAGDAANVQFDRRFDLILADVPCSGTGTLARNPEIRHRLQPEDLKRQQERQVQLLLAGIAALNTRGRLTYSTCSLETEENEVVVEQALKRRRDVRVLDLNARVVELAKLGIVHEEGAARLREQAIRGDALRTMPGRDACDGFFAVVLQRS
jgi:16S rRNA (cytosine967-C5)-methyltransferase